MAKVLAASVFMANVTEPWDLFHKYFMKLFKKQQTLIRSFCSITKLWYSYNIGKMNLREPAKCILIFNRLSPPIYYKYCWKEIHSLL